MTLKGRVSSYRNRLKRLGPLLYPFKPHRCVNPQRSGITHLCADERSDARKHSHTVQVTLFAMNHSECGNEVGVLHWQGHGRVSSSQGRFESWIFGTPLTSRESETCKIHRLGPGPPDRCGGRPWLLGRRFNGIAWQCWQSKMGLF